MSEAVGQYLVLLGMYERHGRWDDYLLLVRSPRFLNALAQARRGACGGPDDLLGTIDQALEHAITLGRVPDLAALLLARARWTQRLAIRTPLDALRAGSLDDARLLAGGPQGERAVLWYLLLAWELYDSGDIGGARQVIGDLVRGEPALLASSRDADWAVTLLRPALAFDQDNCANLLRLLDDNALTDLAGELTRAGALSQARTVATAIRLFTDNRVSALAEIAIRQAEADDRPGAEETIALTMGFIAGAGDEAEERPRWLAAVGAARALQGDRDGALTAFGDAFDAAARLGRPSAGIAAVACAQARAGLLDVAALTIAVIDDGDQRSEATAALVSALADRGHAQAAISALSGVWSGSPDYGRAVRAVLRAAAGTDPARAVRLAGELLESGRRDGAVAAIAVAAARAGHGPDAARLADQIADRGWRARALVDLAGGPAGGDVPGPLVRQAIDDVPDVTLRAVLLAELGVTQDGEQRARLLEEAVALAGQAPQAERWEVLASIGHIQGQASLDGTAETFAAARRAVLADYDPWASHRDLHELCRLQRQAGDAAGARDTVAVALAGPGPDPGRWLVPLSLVGIAAAQAEGGVPESAREILPLAAQAAHDLPGEQRREVTGAIARVQAIAGDFDVAERTVLGLLDEAGEEGSGADDEDDDDEGSRIPTAVQAGTAVARELVAAGSRDRAARLLRHLARVTSRQLEYQPAWRDLITELASAQAESGAEQDALETLALDWTPAAGATASGLRGLWQARAGDVGRAVDTVRAIVPLPWRIQALAGLAREVAGEPAKEIVAAALAGATSEASRTGPGADPSGLAGALAAAAEAQAAIGDQGAARHGLAQAADLAARIPSRDGQARELAGIVRGWIAIGDPDQALRVARGIAHPWYAGEAMAAAVAAASRAGRTAEAREAAVLIDEPGWRAVALVTVALRSPAGGETPLDLAEVQGLVDRVPEGSPRTRVWQQIIELFVEHGRYALAADLTESIAADPGSQLARIAGTLAAEGARDALAHMLPRCARYPESAHAACVALARAYPGHALDIAAIVARSSAW